MNSKATPTPWRWEADDKTGGALLYAEMEGRRGDFIGSASRADAEFIIRAVNSFGEVAAFAKAARALADQHTIMIGGTAAFVSARELAALRATLVPFTEKEPKS